MTGRVEHSAGIIPTPFCIGGIYCGLMASDLTHSVAANAMLPDADMPCNHDIDLPLQAG